MEDITSYLQLWIYTRSGSSAPGINIRKEDEGLKVKQAYDSGDVDKLGVLLNGMLQTVNYYMDPSHDGKRKLARHFRDYVLTQSGGSHVLETKDGAGEVKNNTLDDNQTLPVPTLPLRTLLSTLSACAHVFAHGHYD